MIKTRAARNVHLETGFDTSRRFRSCFSITHRGAVKLLDVSSLVVQLNGQSHVITISQDVQCIMESNPLFPTNTS